MTWPKILVVLFLCYIGFHVAYPTAKIRFRLTVNVETPAGPRSGSSVMEAILYRRPAFGGLFLSPTRLDGEAVFVDLGATADGKPQNLVALLAGRNGEPWDFVRIPFAVFSDYLKANQDARNARTRFRYEGSAKPKAKQAAFNCGEFGDQFCEVAQLPVGSRREVRSDLIPTLITFTNPNDPKSALVINPDSLHGVFGAGFYLKNVTLELVKPASWPLDVFGISGEPLTRRIEVSLPGIWASFRNQRQGYYSGPSGGPFILRRDHLKLEG
jgi:hypothetical protein